MAAGSQITASSPDRLRELGTRIRRMRLPWIPLTIMVTMLTCAVFAPWLAQHDPTAISMLDRRIAPFENPSYPLGTDILGRDMLSRLIYGARTSVFISLVALGTGAFVGTVLGLTAGYRGGWLDILIMRAADAALGFPTVLVAMIIVTILGAGIENIIPGRGCHRVGAVCADDPGRRVVDQRAGFRHVRQDCGLILTCDYCPPHLPQHHQYPVGYHKFASGTGHPSGSVP